MLSIDIIMKALSAIVSAVDQIQQRKKAKQETEQSEGMIKGLKDLEDTDLEQERLIGELSRTVEDLAKAIDTEIEKNRARDLRNQWLAYAALILGTTALVIGIVVLVR
jgi:hypothetical protein